MRVIAGEFRGRKLLAPETEVTRPITDRVKQSLFDILTPRLAGALVWDLFAGTGSLGLESLSRGAERALFFETDRGAVARLRRNIQDLRLRHDRAVVHATDVFKWFRGWDRADAPKSAAPPPRADIIFLDPPYRYLADQPEDLRRLGRLFGRQHLLPQGIVVFRHDARDSLELPGLTRYDQRTYGGMMLEFLAIAEPTNP
jgi:16S rRNA (guanine966-N2)-methyltransferase